MKRTFNLLKPQIEPPTVWTKIYDWIVGTARVIVIVVQIIVIVAFGIRLFLDIQGNKLSEEIEIKEANLRAFQSVEAKYRRIQLKTQAFRTSWTGALVYTDIYKEINSYLPPNLTEISIQLAGTQISIGGSAPTSEVGQLENALKNSPSFQSTELIRIESSGLSDSDIAEFAIRTKVRILPKREIPELVNQEN